MSARDIDVNAFIRDIFIRPPIWDGSFGNRDLLWRDISANHNFLPVDTLKKRWENLRVSFRRQLKKIPRDVNNLYLIDPHDVHSSWPYYRSMLFLVRTDLRHGHVVICKTSGDLNKMFIEQCQVKN